MKICAVICEYNPFHSGHAYHLSKIKEKYDRVICIMSGNFSQRAEPTVFDKYLRAEQALRYGADLVLQLPTVYACASAQFFAKGAINILRNLPINAISFGMENPDVDLLKKIANCANSDAYDDIVKEELAKGNSYVSSSLKALTTFFENDFLSVEKFLSTPNNMLALEYVKAINHYNLDWEIFPIERENNFNDTKLEGAFVSATALRQAIYDNTDYSKYVPDFSAYTAVPKADLNLFNSLAFLAIRTSKNKCANLLNAGEGLENRLYKNSLTSSNLYEMQEKTKSKRYTFARIKRLTLDNLLSIKKDDVVFPDNATAVLLGVKKDFLPYLKDFSAYLITENSQLDKFVPQNFVKIEELAEITYSTLSSTQYKGIIKQLLKV